MPKAREIFTSSDGWLLTTLWCGKREMTRKEVRDLGDYLNCSRFTDQEIDEGIYRLGIAGYARKCEDGKFQISQPGSEIVERHHAGSPGVIKTMMRVVTAIQGKPIVPK